MQRFIITVLGKQGSGKTHLIKRMMPHLPRPVFVIDTMAEFSEGAIFETMRVMREYLVREVPNRTGIYVLRATADAECEAFFRVFPTVQRPATLVVDEASKFCSPHRIDENLGKVINYGRHWRQHLIAAARRPAEVHRDVTAQSNVIVSFQQTERRDVQQLKRSFDEAEHLPMLDASHHEFMVFGDARGLPEGIQEILAEAVDFREVDA